MKKGWLAVGLLAAMVILAFCHVSKLGALTGELGQALREAEALTEGGNWGQAGELTQKARQRWEEHSFYLHVTLDHNSTDEIAAGFAEVSEFLEHREAGEYSAANARLMEKLELLGEMEQPSLENLL